MCSTWSRKHKRTRPPGQSSFTASSARLRVHPICASLLPALSPGSLTLPKLLLGNSLREQVDRSPWLQRLLWACEAALVRILLFACRLFSPDRASAAGRRLMRWLGPRLEKTGWLARNIKVAFPEKSPAEADALLRDIWGNIGSVVAEYAHLETICGREAEERLEIVTRGDIEAFKGTGKPAIFVAGHLANWEVTPTGSLLMGAPVKVVYSPLQHPWIDRMMRRKRERLGGDLVNLQDGIRAMVRHLRSGSSIGLLVDQRSDRGEPVPFFGQDMLTTTIPARLALRYGCELVPVRAERLEGARFRVTFYEPIEPDPAIEEESQQVLAMTTKINALFEAWIRERPHEWFCSKRKWPKESWKGIRHPREEARAAGADRTADPQTLSASSRTSQSVTVRSS